MPACPPNPVPVRRNVGSLRLRRDLSHALRGLAVILGHTIRRRGTGLMTGPGCAGNQPVKIVRNVFDGAGAAALEAN